MKNGKRESDQIQMDFSPPRMLALRVIYFLVGVGAILVAKDYFHLSDQVTWILILLTLVAVAVSYPLQLRLIRSVAYYEKRLGPKSMIGLEGIAMEDLTPSGRVKVRGEIWKALSRSGPIEKGQEIRVVEVEEGLTLQVEEIP